MLRGNGTQRGDEQQRHERNQYRHDRDGSKAINGIESCAKPRSERKGGEHRHPDPGYDSPCVLRSDESESPGHRTRDDEALSDPEQGTAEKQNRDGHPRHADKTKRQEIEQPAHYCSREARDNRALCASVSRRGRSAGFHA